MIRNLNPRSRQSLSQNLGQFLRKTAPLDSNSIASDIACQNTHFLVSSQSLGVFGVGREYRSLSQEQQQSGPDKNSHVNNPDVKDFQSFSGGRERCFGSSSNFGKHHHERKLLGYTQEQLYAVVSDVSNYKEFVPWCQRSVVTEAKPPEYMEAELEVGFKMFVERYTSQVYMTEPSKVLSKVSDSTLFDHLDTTWEFKAGPTPSTTWLNFDLAFAFKSPLYSQIASVFFDEVVKRMMAAFEQRCKVLYGESALHQKRRMQA